MASASAGLNVVPIPQGGIEFAELEGEGVLYRSDTMTMIYLNESASVVWRLCDGRRTIASIVETLVQAFPDQANRVSLDVREAIDQLVREGVLELGDA